MVGSGDRTHNSQSVRSYSGLTATLISSKKQYLYIQVYTLLVLQIFSTQKLIMLFPKKSSEKCLSKLQSTNISHFTVPNNFTFEVNREKKTLKLNCVRSQNWSQYSATV